MTLLSILSIMVAPTALAATSSSEWSFEMENRFVSGKANGQYHSLSAGTLSIEGKLTATKQSGKKPTPSP
ncbi:hypothetical protein ACEQ6C_38740, partial [Rhizobium ruizarguesonis]